MTYLGTRPPLISETNLYELHHRARLAIKPGITGMWQVSGRSDITDFEEVVRLDKEYITNWNIGLDIKILLKRLVSMITSKAPNAKVDVLYNAVPTYKDNPRNKEAKNVLFLGRLGKRKGTYDLLNAIKNIEEDLPKDVKFYLCGDGDIEGINKEIDKLNISKWIAHVGWIDSNEKKEIYNTIAINVLPSYNEGLPIWFAFCIN